MAEEPKRREQPHRFLDASLVPLERALKYRADVLREHVAELELTPGERLVKSMLADEYQTLAEELHYW